MTIVFDERSWAKEMIRTRSLGKSSSETLRRVARYYLDCGHDKKEVRNMLDAFLLQCDPTASLVKWSPVIDRAVSHAVKHPAVRIGHIDITKPELDRITAIDSRQLRRLAFALLSLSKYWDAYYGKSSHWVYTPVAKVMAMANLNTSIKRRSQMFRKLSDLGLIAFSEKIDNTNVRVLFAEPGDTAVSVTDPRNLGYQLNMALGERDYFVCENCGIVSKKNKREDARGRAQKYCPTCAVEVFTRQRVNSAMRHYAKTVGSDTKICEK